MPHEQMNEKQVASYVHLDLREVVKLASRGDIPCRRASGGYVFRKSDVDHWIEAHMHTLDRNRLVGIERGVIAHHGSDSDEGSESFICQMIPRGAVAVPLKAKTRESAIRALVELADQAELVYARDDLLKEIREREQLCSTALWPGVALPHPRHPLPYDIAASFVVAGVTLSGIPYGCPNGSLTRLFFLICCKDDRTHLHVLARLAQMLHNQSDIDRLMHVEAPDEFTDILWQLEEVVLTDDDTN